MQRIVARWGLVLALVATFSQSAGAQTAAGAPCGFATFLPVGPPYFASGTAYEKIRARLTFPDGHTESAVFPYPWIYPDGEQTDPWSSTNLRRSNFPVTLQFPPAGFDRSLLEPLLAFLIAHSNKLGYTDLKECARPRSSPLPATPAASPGGGAG